MVRAGALRGTESDGWSDLLVDGVE